MLVQHLGLVSTGTTTKTSTISRDLYHRAIEVMAGAHALGEFVSLDAAESFAIEYWPLELYKLAQAPPPGELQGQVALVTGGAGGIGRAIGDALAAAGACVVAFDLDQSGAEDAVAAYGDGGLAVSGDVTSEEAVAAAFAAAVERFGGVDILVSNAGVASSAAIEETTLDEWNRNHAHPRDRLLPRRARGVHGSCSSRASAARSCSSPPRTRSSPARTPPRTRRPRPPSCTSRAASPRRAARAGIRVNTVNPDAVLQGSRIWGSSWREERAAAYGIEPDELEEHYRKRTTLRVNIFPEDIAQAVLHFASPARSGKSTGNLLNVDGGRAGGLRALAVQGGPVDQLLDVAVERPGLEQLEVEVARALEDRRAPVCPLITGKSVTWTRSTRPAAISDQFIHRLPWSAAARRAPA